MYQWTITIGLLVASITDNGTKDRSGAASYLIPICLQFVWAAVLFTGLIFLPESPRYRVKQGRDEDAAKILAQLNSRSVDDPIIQHELKHIRDSYEEEVRAGKSKLKEIFSRGEDRYRDRLFLAAALQALQQLTGINFIFYVSGDGVRVNNCPDVHRLSTCQIVRCDILQIHRSQESIHIQHHQQCGQRGIHHPWNVVHGALWSTNSLHLGRRRDVHLPDVRGCDRHIIYH